MEDRIYLGRDILVELGKTSQRIFIVNPEVLIQKDQYEIWRNLRNTFGKCEVENWVAEELCSSAKFAVEHGLERADISELASATLYNTHRADKNWHLLMPNDIFKKKITELPFIKKKEEENDILLEFVSEY